MRYDVFVSAGLGLWVFYRSVWTREEAIDAAYRLSVRYLTQVRYPDGTILS